MSGIAAILESKWFDISEFKNCPHPELIDPRLIRSLDELRDRTGIPLHPSRHPMGWTRTTGSKTSRHYAVGRLSDAGDLFPAHSAVDVILAAHRMPAFGGFGLYLDTKISELQPGPMIHLDLRPGPERYWVRIESGDYVYHHKEPSQFWFAIERAQEMS